MISLFQGMGELLYVNRTVRTYFGVTLDEVIGRSFIRWLPEEDRDRVESALGALSPAQPQCVLEHRAKRADGQWRWQRWINQGRFDAVGQMVDCIGVGMDVTELHEAQETLRQREKTFRLIIEHSGEMFYICTPDHGVTYLSPQCQEFLGCSPEEARCRWMDFVTDHPANQAAYEATCRAIETGQPQPPHELELKRADGSTLWVEAVEFPVVQDGRTVLMVGTWRRITERKRLEQERRQLETQWQHQARLESLGTLAGGLAHEINNPLTGILNYAELIQSEAPPGSEWASYAAEIRREGERVARVVRSLLTFAPSGGGADEVIAPADLVRNVLALMETALLQEHIRCDVEFPPDLPLIRCVPEEIQQALMHVVMNARDALNARFPDRDERKRLRLRGEVFEEGGQLWVRLRVEDWGEGIPPARQARIFEPFFTTRSRARYSGLGLSISLGILRRHGGRLRCESREGGPTRFDLELPVHGGAASQPS